MKAFDVVALGELLIDFTQNGVSDQGNPVFEANPGGAPCNVLAMLRKLDKSCAFIGKVGDDMFGHRLRAVAEDAGICMDALRMDPSVRTTLAFVRNDENGDRDFSFYRNPGADMMLQADEIPESIIAQSKIFHFGTLSMTHPGVEAATRRAIAIAEENGVLRSFDPNLRPPLWNDLEDAKKAVRYGLAHCDILKISDNEIQWLTGETDFTAGVNALRSEFDIPLILVSMGPDGSRAYTKELMVEVPAQLNPNTIETTGAGDTFCACVLHDVLENGLTSFTAERLEKMLTLANAAASLVTTRRGALRVMPTPEEIAAYLNERA
jgi:fructokinase